MLNRLLQLIDEAGGTLALSALAGELGTSQALVESMLEQLVHLGYLVPVDPRCGSGACSRCPQRGACAIPSQARLWALTERGRQAVQPGEGQAAAEPSPALQ